MMMPVGSSDKKKPIRNIVKIFEPTHGMEVTSIPEFSQASENA